MCTCVPSIVDDAPTVSLRAPSDAISACSDGDGAVPRKRSCSRERAMREPFESNTETIQSSGTRCSLTTRRIASGRTTADST